MSETYGCGSKAWSCDGSCMYCAGKDLPLGTTSLARCVADAPDIRYRSDSRQPSRVRGITAETVLEVIHGGGRTIAVEPSACEKFKGLNEGHRLHCNSGVRFPGTLASIREHTMRIRVGQKMQVWWFTGNADNMAMILEILPYTGQFTDLFDCVLRLSAPNTIRGYMEMAYKRG